MKAKRRPLRGWGRGARAEEPGAFLQGSAAFACGVPYENNPYKKKAPREQWGLGWKRRSEGILDFSKPCK